MIYNLEVDGYATQDNVGRVIYTEDISRGALFESVKQVAQFMVDNRVPFSRDLTIIYVEIVVTVKPDFRLDASGPVKEEIYDITNGEDYMGTLSPLLNPNAAKKENEKRKKNQPMTPAQKMKEELAKPINDGIDYDPSDVTTNTFL